MKMSRNRQMGAAAIAAVALAGVGTAFAASKLHTTSNGNAARNAFGQRGGMGGPPGNFSPNGNSGSGSGQFTPPSGSSGSQRFGFRGGFGGGLGGLSAAATYLGISQTQLFSDLQSGKTLADIAKATDGKSVDGLVDAMVAAQKAQLAAAVKAGRITQALATQIGANLKQRVTQTVNGSFGLRGGFGGGPPGGGNGNGGGFGPPGSQGGGSQGGGSSPSQPAPGSSGTTT